MGRALRCRTPGSHQGLAHRGASAGGPRLSAPTEPRLPQCALPVGVQDQSQPAPVRPRCSQEALFCETGTRGQHSPLKQPRLPANTPCPRRAALQRPRRTLRPAARPGRPARARTRVLTHTARTHTGCWDPRACDPHACPCGTTHRRTNVLGGGSSSAAISETLGGLALLQEGLRTLRAVVGGWVWPPGFPRGQLPISRS